MARTALGTARNLFGCVLVLLLAPGTVSAQGEAIVRVSATVVAPGVLAPQMSAAQEGAAIVETVRTADVASNRTAAEAGHGAMVSVATVAGEPSDGSRALQRDAEPADRLVRVTVAYASN